VNLVEDDLTQHDPSAAGVEQEVPCQLRDRGGEEDLIGRREPRPLGEEPSPPPRRHDVRVGADIETLFNVFGDRCAHF